jgi:hypothetical protein
MFTASAGHRYFVGFFGGTSFVAIPHLSLPYTHNQAEKKRGIEIFLRFFVIPIRALLAINARDASLDCSFPHTDIRHFAMPFGSLRK